MMVSTVMVETTTEEMEEEEDEQGKVKKFPFSKQEGVILESENKFFLGRKEVILICLEDKSDGYSLEGQYPLVEEEQKLEV